MLDLRRSRSARWTTFGALYFAQGVPLGFVSLALPIELADRVDQSTISSLLAIAILPWSLKVFAAPLVDRFALVPRAGRRRPWILLAQLFMALTILALLVTPAASVAFAALVFLHNVGAALQDVATDALAVDVLSAKERGKANSVMWGAKAAGVALGGAPLSWLGNWVGFEWTFVVQFILLMAVAGLVLVVREGEAPRGGAESTFSLPELARSFATRATFAGLVLALVVMTASDLTGALVVPMLRTELGWSEGDVQLRVGTYVVVAGVVSAIFGGVIVDRYGRRLTLASAVVVIALVHLALVISPELRHSMNAMTLWFAVRGIATTVAMTALITLLMDVTNPKVGATMVTAYFSLANLNTVWAAALGGALADAWGRLPVFALSVPAALLGLLPLAWMGRARALDRRTRAPIEAQSR